MLAYSTLRWPFGEAVNTETAVCLRLGGAGYYWKSELPSETQEKTGLEKGSGCRVNADSKLEPECLCTKCLFVGLSKHPTQPGRYAVARMLA